MAETASPPAPAPAKEIFVSEMSKAIATNPVEAAAAAKAAPGSAKDRMFADLESKAVDTTAQQPQEKTNARNPKATPAKEKPVAKAAAAAPADAADSDADPGDGDEAAPASEGDDAGADAKSAADGKSAKPGEADKKKVNPWKLVEEYKTKLAAKEKEVLETSKRAIDPAKWKEYEEKLAATAKRNEELEQHIRYVDYSKSKEFQEKYQAPYDAAWKRAMSELGELTVETEAGEVRSIQPTDILDLVNLTLPEARARAVELYGDFANDVMQHRKEIRNLYDQQAGALEEARKSGVERTQKQQEEFTARQQQMSAEIRETWTKANEEATAHEKYGKFFKPIEGDQDGNQRLAKGFELADRAFSENPMNAKTPEERKAIVQRHAAIRNRAAAYGRVVKWLEERDATITELKEKLAQYTDGEPESAGRKPNTEKKVGSAKDSMWEKLESIAR